MKDKRVTEKATYKAIFHTYKSIHSRKRDRGNRMARDETRKGWSDREVTTISPRVNWCEIHLFLEITHTHNRTHLFM